MDLFLSSCANTFTCSAAAWLVLVLALRNWLLRLSNSCWPALLTSSSSSSQRCLSNCHFLFLSERVWNTEFNAQDEDSIIWCFPLTHVHTDRTHSFQTVFLRVQVLEFFLHVVEFVLQFLSFLFFYLVLTLHSVCGLLQLWNTQIQILTSSFSQVFSMQWFTVTNVWHIFPYWKQKEFQTKTKQNWTKKQKLNKKKAK